MDYVGLTLWVSKSQFLGENFWGENGLVFFPLKGIVMLIKGTGANIKTFLGEEENDGGKTIF